MTSQEKIDILPYSDDSKQLKIIQNPQYFCYGIDAILLSHFVQTKKNSKLIDLCSGNGIIPLLLSKNSEITEITGIEIQEYCCSLANRSAKLNNLESKVKFLNEDIKNIKTILPPKSADIITCNPPYMTTNSGTYNLSPKAIARQEIECTFEDVVSCAKYLLNPSGSFYLIHRPNRLPELFTTLKNYNFEIKKIRFIFPQKDKDSTMVLIQAKQNSKAQLTVEPPIIIYDTSGKYTEQMEEIRKKIFDL